MQAIGHEAILFGRSGPLVSRAKELDLEFVESPQPGRRPSPSVARALAALVRKREIDVLHGYEWPPALEAALSGVRCPTPAVATIMSMSVPPFIPHSMHLVVGTEEIAAVERAAGRRRVSVIEPPVDTEHNAPGSGPAPHTFRTKYSLDDDRLTIVSVTRFARELKLEGILTAIDVVGDLAHTLPIRLVLIGDGPARPDVEKRARAINAACDDNIVILTGQLADPRPAYAAADIALGMGGSALRAMAYAKPLVVQGEKGFWRILTPDSVNQFLWTGWYGVGNGAATGSAALREALMLLLSDDALRRRLGDFGRKLVTERFSLSRAADRQLNVYRTAIAEVTRWRRLAETIALAQYSGYYVGKRLRRIQGREAADDFNAQPVTAINQARRTQQYG